MPAVEDDSPFAPSWDPLALDREAMRALGHRTVDAVVDMLTDPATPCLRRATPGEMEERLPATLPEEPRAFDELLEQLRADVFPWMSRLDHPRLLRLHPGVRHVPGRAGGLHVRRAQPLRGHVDGGRGPEPARAGGAGLVPELDRLPAGGARACSSAAARRPT